VDVNAKATVTQPNWIERPTAADIARLYPAQAAREGLAARVAMTCRFGADGRLANCGIAKSEVEGATTPRIDIEMDFGTATLQLAKLFRAAPMGRDGAPVAGGIVRIPVRWAPVTTPAT
jgi:periplasmic protein TonB